MKNWIILLVLLCAILGAGGQIFFKLASKDVSLNLFDWITNYKFIFGAAMYALSAILFVWALKYGDLSILYPIIATSYIWVMIFSYLILGESFSLTKAIGTLLILLGIGAIVR
jgi:uncharacterized membrane protein